MAHYRAGFNHSAMEINKYLMDTPDLQLKVRHRLLTHLSNTCHALFSNHQNIQHTKQYNLPMYQMPATVITNEPSSSKEIFFNSSTTSTILNEPHTLYSHMPQSSEFVNDKLSIQPTSHAFNPFEQSKLTSLGHFKKEAGFSTATITYSNKAKPKHCNHTSNSTWRLENIHRNSAENNSISNANEENTVWRPWS